jgi:hypothetical protein
VEAYAGSLKIGYYEVNTAGRYGFLAAYRDDPTTPEKDGATPGDPIRFTINEGPATPVGDYGGNTNPTWTANAASIQVDLASQSVVERSIPLRTNWNLISFDVWPISGTQVITDPVRVLQPITGCYGIVMSFDPAGGGGQTYDPRLPAFSTLRSLDPLHGYWIKALCDVNLGLRGQEVPINASLPLTTGWNLAPYWPNSSLAVTVALGSINGRYSLVRGFDPVRGGQTYDPALPDFSTLLALSPLRGYWIRMNTSGRLTYPGGGAAGIRESAFPAGRCGEGAHASTEWVSFYSANSDIGGVQLPVGACVEAYAGSVKIGYYVVGAAGKYGFLAAYGDDPTTTEKDGAQVGEAITFTVNGHPVVLSSRFGGDLHPTWTRDGLPIQADLTGTRPAGNVLYLPLILR